MSCGINSQHHCLVRQEGKEERNVSNHFSVQVEIVPDLSAAQMKLVI